METYPLKVIVLITTFGMITTNVIFGKNTGNVSRKYSLIVTPPGPFFAIWSFIYLGLIIAGVYCRGTNVWSPTMILMFSLGNILNGLWSYVFGFGTIRNINICLFILFNMAVINEFLWFETTMINTGTIWDIINCNIIAFYQGWLVVALNLNLGITLVYYFGISKKTQAFIFWTIVPIMVVEIVLLNLTAHNGFQNNIGMYFTAIYGIVGAYISTSHPKKEDEIDNREKSV